MQRVEVLQLPVLKSPGASAAQPHRRPLPATSYCLPLEGGGLCPQGQAPPSSVCGVENNGKQPEQIALSQKTVLLLLPTTPGDHWREMGSWKGKTALPAWQPPSWLPVSEVTGLHGKRPTVLWPHSYPNTASVSTLPCRAHLPLPPHYLLRVLPSISQSHKCRPQLKIEPLYWYL